MTSYTRTVNFSLPRNPNAPLIFTPLDSVLINDAGEIVTKAARSATTDGQGAGSIVLDTPDDSGRRAWVWQVELPDGETPQFALTWGAGAAPLAALLAADASRLTPNVLASLLASLYSLNNDEVDWLSGARTAVPDGADVVAADDLGTAAAANVEDFEPTLGNPATNGFVLSSTTLGARSWITLPTATDRVAKAGDTMTGKLSIGNNAPTADDTLFNVNRSITTAINSHAYRDESSHTPAAGSTGYGAYDAQFTMAGTQNYDHFAGFQSRPEYLGSGTIAKHNGFWSLPEHSGAGTLTALSHFRAANVSGGGTVTTQYGLYIEELTGGATNYAVFTAGATPSYFGGLLWTNANFRVDGLASFGNVAANTAYQVYTATTLDATKIAANAVLATAPINLSTGNSYGAFYSITAANNTLGSIGTNFIYGFTARALIQATAANSAVRYAYALHAQASASANGGYTATALGMYGVLVDSFVASGAGTLSFGETVGVAINNQGTTKAPASYGIKVADQSGSTNSYSIYTGAGTVRLMASATDKLGFHGVTPVVQQVLPTGASKTVDEVITFLQTIGLCKQS